MPLIGGRFDGSVCIRPYGDPDLTEHHLVNVVQPPHLAEELYVVQRTEALGRVAWQAVAAEDVEREWRDPDAENMRARYADAGALLLTDPTGCQHEWREWTSRTGRRMRHCPKCQVSQGMAI